MTSQPQDTTPDGETRAEEGNEPNEFGFGGDGTGPEPDRSSTGESFGEAVAIPAGDITGAITAAIEEATDSGRGDGGSADDNRADEDRAGSVEIDGEDEQRP